MVWSLEMRGYRSGERKVRDPGGNGENNKNTFGLRHAINIAVAFTKSAVLKMFILFTSFRYFMRPGDPQERGFNASHTTVSK